jgi:hypothetical protein
MQRAVPSSSSSLSAPLPQRNPATLKPSTAANPLDGLDDQSYVALLASMPDAAMPTYGVLYTMHQMLTLPPQFSAKLRHVATTYNEQTLRDFLATLQAGFEARGAWRYIYLRLLYEEAQDSAATLESLFRSASTPLSSYLAVSLVEPAARGHLEFVRKHSDTPLPPYILPSGGGKLELRGRREESLYNASTSAEHFARTLQHAACKALVQTALDDVVAYSGTRMTPAVVASMALAHNAAFGFYVLAEYATALESDTLPCFGDRLAMRSGTVYNSLAAFVERKKPAKEVIKASGAEAAPILTAHLADLLSRYPALAGDKLYDKLHDLSRRYSSTLFIVAGKADDVNQWISDTERRLIKRRGRRLAEALRRMMLFHYQQVHDDALRALAGAFTV